MEKVYARYPQTDIANPVPALCCDRCIGGVAYTRHSASEHCGSANTFCVAFAYANTYSKPYAESNTNCYTNGDGNGNIDCYRNSDLYADDDTHVSGTVD